MYVSSSKDTSVVALVSLASVAIAAAAAPLASIQPLIITTRTGSSSVGTSVTKRWSSATRTLQPGGGHRGRRVDLVLEHLQLGRLAVTERPSEVPRVHTLEHAGQLPEPESHVEVERRDVPTRHLGVARRHPVPVPEPGRRRRPPRPRALVIVGAGPVHLEQADVGQWVAERADLPVEHGK